MCGYLHLQAERKMGTSQIHSQARETQIRQFPNANLRLDEHIVRALNKIRKPSTAEEIAELVNRDLGAGELPFHPKEIAGWLRASHKDVLNLYWLGTRPRK